MVSVFLNVEHLISSLLWLTCASPIPYDSEGYQMEVEDDIREPFSLSIKFNFVTELVFRMVR